MEDQEVLCSNCFETLAMDQVDFHSTTCFKGTEFTSRSHRYVTENEEQEYNAKTEEINERLSKLIKTMINKLDSEPDVGNNRNSFTTE